MIQESLNLKYEPASVTKRNHPCRKYLGPGESAPGKIAIAWVNDFLLELGVDQTEANQKRYRPRKRKHSESFPCKCKALTAVQARLWLC